MPGFRLIAADLDDTLLDDNLQVSPRTVKALKKALEMGCVVTIATGRMFRSARQIALDLGIIEAPIITYLGALVKNARSEEALAETPVPFDLAEFMHPQATKKNALHNLARSLGIPREKIIAFGDSYNDLDMIQYAGMGVSKVLERFLE
ncbi:HAD family hydrolase [Phosphitispora sp. TUW77]|uniref:HAD family hydrolase n=1 Tax=Phosphitispora sp. TUW77 TaxID=3152361 RepID=UPI003AB1E1C1